MRAKVATMYNGKRWQERVKHMPDGQIIRLYHKCFLEKERKARNDGKSD